MFHFINIIKYLQTCFLLPWSFSLLNYLLVTYIHVHAIKEFCCIKYIEVHYNKNVTKNNINGYKIVVQNTCVRTWDKHRELQRASLVLTGDGSFTKLLLSDCRGIFRQLELPFPFLHLHFLVSMWRLRIVSSFKHHYFFPHHYSLDLSSQWLKVCVRIWKALVTDVIPKSVTKLIFPRRDVCIQIKKNLI